MNLDAVMKQLEHRLRLLEEMVALHQSMQGCKDAGPSREEAENLAAAVSNLLLSIQAEVASSLGPGNAEQGDDLARQLSELDALMQVFHRPGTARPH